MKAPCREFQNRNDLVACKAIIEVDQFLNGHIIYEVFEDHRNRNSRSAEYPGAAQFTGIALYGFAFGPIKGCHDELLLTYHGLRMTVGAAGRECAKRFKRVRPCRTEADGNQCRQQY